jgi:hypothetical protein
MRGVRVIQAWCVALFVCVCFDSPLSCFPPPAAAAAIAAAPCALPMLLQFYLKLFRGTFCY